MEVAIDNKSGEAEVGSAGEQPTRNSLMTDKNVVGKGA